MKNDRGIGLILMTALLPTKGHVNLIKFSLQFCTEVHVAISTRSFEPEVVKDRVKWLQEELIHYTSVRFYELADNEAPQNPEDHPDFWSWWKKAITKVTGECQYDAVFASETYGVKLAETFGAEFIPYDVRRDIDYCSGTAVRKSIISHWEKIILPARRHLLSKFVLFGQESVGKSTIANRLARFGWIKSYPEYARQYLETVGKELSREKMLAISKGQSAYQRMAINDAERPAIAFDTDMFSTLGYYIIMERREWIKDWISNEILTSKMKNDVYFILPDDTPFASDQLRYGIDKRESTKQFWIDIAIGYNLKYVLIPEGTLESKVEFIYNYMNRYCEDKFKELSSFERD